MTFMAYPSSKRRGTTQPAKKRSNRTRLPNGTWADLEVCKDCMGAIHAPGQHLTPEVLALLKMQAEQTPKDALAKVGGS